MSAGGAVSAVNLEWDENGQATLGGEFEFILHRPYSSGTWHSSDRWGVGLPHQCDDWDIVGYYGSATTHAEAVAGLERFITEAQAALAALRQAES
jgi:hypothetical protein